MRKRARRIEYASGLLVLGCAKVTHITRAWAETLLADDHKFLVELACSTTLTPAYKSELFKHLVPKAVGPEEKKAVVFIICGGSKISLYDMEEYRKVVDRDMEGRGEAWSVLGSGGESIVITK